MAASLKIREERDGLVIRVTEPRQLGRVATVLVFGCAASLLIFHFASESPLYQYAIGALCLFSIVQGVISGMRGTDVVLRMNDLDLTTLGHCPEDFTPGGIARADILAMEYRSASGGGDSPDLPEGLYVQYLGALWDGWTCVLPNVDEAQCKEVIEAIYRRFPDTGTLTPTGPFEPYLTSLNLNRP